MEAVLVSMSCFALLCEEAEILCGSDEVAVTCLLPNYQLYLELAQASTVLISGKFDLFYALIDFTLGTNRKKCGMNPFFSILINKTLIQL